MILNTTQTILLVVIIALAAYIIYLQIQLVRKNILIESIARKISGLERSLKPEELKKIIGELPILSPKSQSGNDSVFDENVINFIIDGIRDKNTYIHYTMNENVALRILGEGFKFADSFYNTALEVSNDKLDLLIKHNNKKYYGDYIIVINISSELVNRYTDELEKAGIKDYSFENILTETPPVKNENSELIYLLPSQYIKGYVNYRTGEITSNPAFRPGYVSSGFSENIKLLKSARIMN